MSDHRSEEKRLSGIYLGKDRDELRELLFERDTEIARLRKERDRYKQALQDICTMGRSPIAEGALGI